MIEAVSALEVAILEFSKNPNYLRFMDSETIERIAQKSLASQVQNLGLRGTIRFLFPIIFKSDIMPGNVLIDCQRAVDIRNNVVHNGQRRVDSNEIWRILRSIKRMCLLLEDYALK